MKNTTNKKSLIDVASMKGKLNLYKPTPTKQNRTIGLIIIAYALLPLFSLWALPLGMFVFMSSIDLKLLLVNKLKQKGLYTL